MKTMIQAGSLILALGLGAAGALAQTGPGTQPPGVGGQPKSGLPPKAVPMPPAPHAGPQGGHAAMNGGGSMGPHAGRSGYPDSGTMHQPGHAHQFMPQPRPTYGVANHRPPGYSPRYGMRPQRFMRYGENPATWSPRYHRPLRYAYAPRPRGHEPRYQEYAPRLSYGYGRRVSYAYAETPVAYDLPRETYATGIFATASTVGLHTYDYAYTTRVRPIAAYAGPTGSYAGGYPIYNRPLAPAYPTPGCACD